MNWWLVILMFTIYFAANSFLYFKSQPPQYQVVTRIYVNQGVKNALVNTLDSASADRATNTVAALAKSESVISDISAKTSIPYWELAKAINVKILTGTQLIEVTTENPDQNEIVAIAKNLSPSLSEFLAKVQVGTEPGDQIKISVADNSLNPGLVNPFLAYQMTFIVIILSIFLFLILFYLLEFFNDTFDVTTDLVNLKITHLGDFGVIKQIADAPASIIHKDNRIAAEMLREVRTNIEYLEKNKQIESILVTSANPREGKSIFSANLAIMFAQAGKKVILIDADMRNPFLHKMFEIHNEVGLVDYLGGKESDFAKLLKPTGFKNLLVMNAGRRIANPSELIQIPKLEKIKEELKKLHADLIIFDTPPLGIITDAAIIAQSVDGAILAIEKDRTKVNDVKKVQNAFEKVNAKIIGAVSTKVNGGKNYYGYY